MSSKFRFKIQSHQSDAVNAVVGVFKGQPKKNVDRYTCAPGSTKDKTGNFLTAIENLDVGNTENIYEISDIGFANAPIALDEDQLLANIRAIQQRYQVDRQSDELNQENGMVSLDVEMETGTGKTYVYIKTLFELNKLYGWSKFIIVVPSVAIREGVKKSFEQMEDHFMEDPEYKKKASYFVYDSDNLTRLDDFAKENKIQVMIINYQAFNSTKNSNIIDTETEKFQDCRPIDVISATRPILILDEPQKLGGTATQAGLKKFKALFAINYSATHVREHNLIYQLDALAAYNQFLVKKIEVKGFEINNRQGTNKYLYLESIILKENEAPKAKIEFEQKLKSGEVKRKTCIMCKGDNLYEKSGEMQQYADRYVITEIDGREGYNEVTFLNGEKIKVKELKGFIEESQKRRVQIRETIVSHFDKEEKILYRNRIKCLSLFFIDEVAKYKRYSESGEEQGGEYAKIFEEEYTAELKHRLTTTTNEDYKKYLQEMCIDAKKVHNGYFSIDKKTKRMVDSTGDRKTGESDDISAYDLILKNKERLLSYEEPTRFIFSHSALREGWDNPNVFQICTLKESDRKVSKRQEIGRGLRICRDSILYCLQDRQHIKSDDLFHKINKLTVIATESYHDFVMAFQDEMAEVIKDKPTQANEYYFEGKLLFDAEDKPIKVNQIMTRQIYKYLLKNDYIDNMDHVSEKYRNDLATQTLKPLPEEIATYADSVHKLIQGVYDPKILRRMIEDGNRPKQIVKTNQNFNRTEFQALWNEINHRYAYQVDFDSNELITKAVKVIDEELRVSEQTYTVTYAEQKQKMEAEKLREKDIFQGTKTRTVKMDSTDSDIEYDLVGRIAKATTLTRRTVVKILTKIKKETFDKFQDNPDEFMTNISRIIQEQKATTLVEHIVYNIAEGSYDNDIFTLQKTQVEYETAQDAHKHVLNKVFVDSEKESELAKAMDSAEEVVVYAKLPRTFQIPTPVGDYSPDWIIAFKDDKGIKHIYFIAETKGDLSTLKLRPVENAKIQCARKLFNNLSNVKVRYDAITDYNQLLNLVRSG